MPFTAGSREENELWNNKNREIFLKNNGKFPSLKKKLKLKKNPAKLRAY